MMTVRHCFELLAQDECKEGINTDCSKKEMFPK